MEGRIFNIEHYAIHDGPGVRSTVFMKGCPLKCIWCHNPEGMDLMDDVECRIMTPEEVIEEVMKDVLFYDESGGGVTFSGGEPLMQVDFLEACLKLAKEHHLNTAIETSGFAPCEAVERIAPYVDLFLFDMKPILPELHKKCTGVDNTIVKENLKRLVELGADISLCMVAVPGINDSSEVMDAFADFLLPLGIDELTLLPLHKSAKNKYERLGKEFLIDDLEVPSEEKMDWWTKEYEKRGFTVTVGRTEE
jgi:pyruvate formate lyase activating enzyme